jgi:hypothetical protein
MEFEKLPGSLVPHFPSPTLQNQVKSTQDLGADTTAQVLTFNGASNKREKYQRALLSPLLPLSGFTHISVLGHVNGWREQLECVFGRDNGSNWSMELSSYTKESNVPRKCHSSVGAAIVRVNLVRGNTT